MLSNSIVAGALAAAYVVVLVLLLNPSQPLAPAALGPLAAAIALFYVPSCATIAFLLSLIRSVFGRERFSPAWVSVTVLAWLGAAAAALGALVYWLNISTFALVLESDTATALVQGMIVLTAAAMLFLIIALLQRYGGRRGVWAAWLTTIAVASVAVPLALRGPAMPDPPALRPVAALREVGAADGSRVTIIGLDGASFELIAAAAAEGRLPNFGRLIDAGAVAHLATVHPTSAEAVWTAMMTGKLPQKNGIRSAAVFRRHGHSRSVPVQLLPDFCFATALLRLGLFDEERQTSSSLQATPLWIALHRAGISSSLVNIPLTDPPPSLNGFVVSDRFLRSSGVVGTPSPVWPPELAEAARSAANAALAENLDSPMRQTVAERHRGAAQADREHDAILQQLRAMTPTQVSMVRFESSDAIGHYFLRYSMPSRFGDVTDEDRRRYGGVLEAHYALIDEAIGRALSELDGDDLLLVVSGFGMEPLGPGKRILEQLLGDPEISGTHEAAPDGFLMAFGRPVQHTREIRRASVVDVAPTILYFLGLPVARDMDGFARVDLFLSAFTAERPIASIPSYDR